MAPSRIDRPTGINPALPSSTEEARTPSSAERSTGTRAPAPPSTDRLDRTGGVPPLTGHTSPSTSPANLARVEGTMHTPPVVLSPVHLMGQLEECQLSVKVPLRSSADLGGLISVRENTDAWLTLNIKDGEIDLKKTLFQIKDREGKDYTLDGPLWLNPDKVYIDEDGQLRAKLPCFPDPNITKQLLGPDADRVPKDPGEFLQRVTRGNNVDLQIIDKMKIGETPEPCDTDAAAAEPNALDKVVDLTGLNFEFSGKMKAGPIKLGPGVTMNLKEGGELQASGTLQDMDVVIDTPLKSLSLSESGTKITGGNGRAKMNVNFKRQGDSPDAPCSINLGFDALEVDKFKLTTPAVDDTKHNLNIGHLNIEETNGKPLLTMQSDGEGESNLRLELDKVTLDDISGELIVKDTHGALVELGLGRDPGEDRAPMNIETTVVLDTGLKDFQVVARADNLRATVGKLGLVETQNFDLTLESGIITGSGAINVTQSEHDSHLKVIADENTAWTIETDLHDAHIGVATEKAKVIADLSTDTRGTISLRELDISPNCPPVFNASARFTVSLDKLSIPFGDRETVDLTAGTTGTLEVREMAWSEGDISPTVDAELRLNVGTDTLLRPGDVPGLKGAKVELDVDTGNSTLVLNAKLDKKGELVLDCGISLRNVEIKTDLRRGDSGVIPLATLPADHLGPVEYKPLNDMRALEVRPELLTLPTASNLSAPSLQAISINPSDTFGVLERAEVRVDIPMDALDDLRIVDYDGTSVVSRLGIGDTVGASVTINSTRGEGSIRAELELMDGSLASGGSKLVLDPPLSLDIWAKYNLPGPLAPETSLGAVVRALEVRVDEDSGEAYLWPDVDLSGLLPQVAEGIGLGDTVRSIIGDKLGEAVIGSDRFPADLEGFLKQLGQKVTLLGEPIVIDPNASVETESPPSTNTADENPGLTALLRAIHFDETDLSVSNAELNNTILPLGDGQQLHFAPGSELRVEGGLNDFRVVGRARLGESRLGGKDLGLDIGSGEADINMHVYRDANGDAHFDLTVSGLNASDVAFETKVGDLSTKVGVSSLENGRVHIGYGGTSDPLFELDLPGVTASIESNGSLCVGEHGGTIHLGGSLEGNLSIRNGQLAGDVHNLKLSADGTGATHGGPLGDRGGHLELDLEGAASLTTDESGQLKFRANPSGAPLTLNTNLDVSDGGKIQITEASVEEVTFTPGINDLDIRGLRGGLSALLAIPIHGHEDSPPLVDIRNAQVMSGGVHLGADGLKTIGDLKVSHFDASVSGLDNFGNSDTDVSIEQLDLRGGAMLRIDGPESISLTESPDDPLLAHAVLDRCRFTTSSPQFNLTMQPGSQITTEVSHLELSQTGDTPGVNIGFKNSQLDAELKEGTVTVGPEGAALQKLHLKAGTRVRADLGELGLKTGRFVEDPEDIDLTLATLPADVLLTGNLRLEGDLATATDIAPEAVNAGRERMSEFEVPEESIQLDQLDSSGKVRIILGVHAAPGSGFVARSHTAIDGSFNTRVRTTINPRDLLNRATAKEPESE